MAAEEERKPDVVEAPKESGSDSTAADISRNSQERSLGQKERDDTQTERRMRGQTVSSADLPLLEFDSALFDIAPAAIYRKTGDVPVVRERAAKGGDEPVSAEKPGRGGDEPVSADKPARHGDGGKKGGVAAPPKADVTLGTVYIVGEYSGEDIKRDVAPATTTDNKGKNLNDIARQHLGADASEDEVQKHVREIARVNKIEDPTKPLEGDYTLKLPGHTKDGGFVTEDRTGNKRTVWDDGTIRIENKDGTGSVRKWQTEGAGYSEHHWGPKAQDNYELRRTEEGKYEVAEAGTENFREPTKEDADIRVERAKLKDLADVRIPESQFRANFDEDMAKFEGRAKQLEDRYVKEGLSQEDAAKKAEKEIAKTYQEVSRMFEFSGDKPTVEFERQIVAMQVMHQAADPTSVDQGQHPTCSVASLEARLYTRNPADMAYMMSELATKGEFRTKGSPPLTVKMPEESIHPLGDEATSHPPVDGSRGYASQIAQVALANIAWEKDNIASGTPEKWRYVQLEESPAGKQPADDGGRVGDFTDPKNPKWRMDGKTPDTSPGVQDRELVGVSNDVTGGSEGPIVIENSKVTKPGKQFIGVGSEQDLIKTLEDAKTNGKLPVLIHVHTGKEPFWTDSNAGSAGGSGGHHMISITDYDSATGKVSVDNQWGESDDHFGANGIPVGDLYNCTTSPKQDLKLEVEANRKSGDINTAKELELLEMDKSDGDIEGKEYEDKLVQLVVDSEIRWLQKQNAGPVSADAEREQEQKVVKFMEILDAMPPAQRQKLAKRVEKEIDAQKKAVCE